MRRAGFLCRAGEAPTLGCFPVPSPAAKALPGAELAGGQKKTLFRGEEGFVNDAGVEPATR